MVDHEDYQETADPTAHAESHEDGGTDEISIAALSGTPAALAAHALLASVHHVKFTAAEARAAINNIFGADGKADTNIDLDTHKLINVVDPTSNQDADTKKARADAITAHAGQATVHQDAPDLILTHKGDVSAHHAKYTDAEARAATLPGSMIAWPTESAPTGWLECDGSAINRTTYAALFAVIAEMYGVGDGSTTFNLPDLRGRFVRGWDHAAGVDPDAAGRTDRGDGTTGDHVGTKQADELESHLHSTLFNNAYTWTAEPIVATGGGPPPGATRWIPSGLTGGNETRPVNIYFMWCIKT